MCWRAQSEQVLQEDLSADSWLQSPGSRPPSLPSLLCPSLARAFSLPPGEVIPVCILGIGHFLLCAPRATSLPPLTFLCLWVAFLLASVPYHLGARWRLGSIYLCIHSIFKFLLFSARDPVQGLMHAKWVLYHQTAPQPCVHSLSTLRSLPGVLNTAAWNDARYNELKSKDHLIRRTHNDEWTQWQSWWDVSEEDLT
jgi:hypothetical protein